MGKGNQMGKGDPPKPGKTEFVLKLRPTRAPKRKNAAAATEETAQQSGSELNNQGSDVGGASPIPSAGAQGQAAGNGQMSEVGMSGVVSMETEELPGTGGAVHQERPSGINPELGPSILVAIENLTTAFQKATLAAEESRRGIDEIRSSLTQAVDRLEACSKQQAESSANTSSAVQQIKEDGSEAKSLIASVDSRLQTISEAVAAVTASLPGQGSNNAVVFMGQGGPSTSGMEASRPHASTSVVVESPTEYCKVTVNGQIHSLLLTYTDQTILTAATSLREFIRRILCKYYSIVELQKYTLKGVGAKREPRPMLPGWLVELIIEAAGTWRPFPAISPEEPADGPLNTAKKLHEQQLSGRVRRLISDILQYFRETRDSEGNMRRRQAPAGGACGPANAPAGEEQDDSDEFGDDNLDDHAGEQPDSPQDELD